MDEGGSEFLKFAVEHEPAPVPDGRSEITSFLSVWSFQYGIPHTAINSLLTGLKKQQYQPETFQDLPKDARTLLQTLRTVDIRILSSGKYFHFSIEESMKTQLKTIPIYSLAKPAALLINIDRLPLAKSSMSSFWTILGLPKGESTPFPIGIFHGISKPEDFDDFLFEFVEEMNNIIGYGGVTCNTPNAPKIVPVKLSGLVCDAPAKSTATGTCRHTGKVF